MMGEWNGLRVIVSPYLATTETRRYTWLQRLLTADIPPWRATYTVTVPSVEVYQTPAGLVMHPATWQALRGVMAQRDATRNDINAVMAARRFR